MGLQLVLCAPRLRRLLDRVRIKRGHNGTWRRWPQVRKKVSRRLSFMPGGNKGIRRGRKRAQRPIRGRSRRKLG
eukprot:2674801-Heterocapsa_arctica.AAC.1